MNQGVKDLSLFLWKDVNPMANTMFPPISPFCDEHILMRDRVVKKVKEIIEKNPNNLPNSVCLSGCKGSGKTTLLKLSASSLKSDGYNVYFFKDAEKISKKVLHSFKLLLEDNTQKVAILIDDIDDFKHLSLYNTLFKNPISHLVTIGTNITNYNPFTYSLEMSDLALHEDDEDFKKLVEHCVKLNTTSPEITHFICHYLLRQCRGHIYPTLALMDHFFTHDDTKQYVVSTDVFLRYFSGPDFSLTQIYDTVVRTCFPLVSRDVTRESVQHLLGGRDDYFLLNSGYWNFGTGRWSTGVSPFLLNAVLASASEEQRELQEQREQQEKSKASQHGLSVDVLSLDENKSFKENTDLVIAAGLAAMKDWSDLRLASNRVTFEKDINAIAFSWASSARTRVPNARLHFEESQTVRFFQGSEATGGGTAIKVLSCATTQEIERNLETFRANADKLGNWKRFVLLNFEVAYLNNSTEDRVTQPKDETARDQVYTFVHSSNNLYRGNKVIRSLAMPNMYAPQKYAVPKRWYSTATVRRVFSAETTTIKSFQFSNRLVMKHAMTCIRNM